MHEHFGKMDSRDCIMLDDIMNGAGTFCNAITTLMKAGANTMTVYVVLSGVFMGLMDLIAVRTKFSKIRVLFIYCGC